MTMVSRGGATMLLAGAAMLVLAGCGRGDGNAANAATTNATQTAAAADAVSETDDPAMDYARLFMPAEQVSSQGVALFRQTFDTGFASNPDNLALERQHPGTQAAAREAGAAAMQAVFQRELPGIQTRIADAVRPQASAEDLREISRFMRTPTAQAMQRAASQGMTGPVTARAGDGGPALRPEDLAKAGQDSVGALTPAQLAELQRFAGTPAGQALNKLAPVSSQLVLTETNALAQRAAPEVSAAISKVVQERTGQ